MSSPYQISCHIDEESQYSANSIEQDIIYIKTSNFCKQLHHFYPQAQTHTVK